MRFISPHCSPQNIQSIKAAEKVEIFWLLRDIPSYLPSQLFVCTLHSTLTIPLVSLTFVSVSHCVAVSYQIFIVQSLFSQIYHKNEMEKFLLSLIRTIHVRRKLKMLPVPILKSRHRFYLNSTEKNSCLHFTQSFFQLHF